MNDTVEFAGKDAIILQKLKEVRDLLERGDITREHALCLFMDLADDIS